VAVFENRQPVTAAKFINKSSLFILLLGVISRLELKPVSEQKVENIFVAPPYSQTAVAGLCLFRMCYLNFQFGPIIFRYPTGMRLDFIVNACKNEMITYIFTLPVPLH
jgi:hypothetical protein